MIERNDNRIVLGIYKSRRWKAGITIEKTIKELLLEMSEEEYRKFSSSLTPGKDNILGVRLPNLRKLAVRIAKDDWRAYLSEATTDTFEEVMLQGMVIGYVKEGLEVMLKLVSDFIPLIDNWSVCDSFCSGLKFTNKYREQVWEFLRPYLESDQEFELRFGLVMLLNYYVLPEYAPKAFNYFDLIHHEGYYVKMAVAWAISIYYIKLPELTLGYLKNCCLDDFTYNKALQKVRESLRVKDEEKDMIKKLKRRT